MQKAFCLYKYYLALLSQFYVSAGGFIVNVTAKVYLEDEDLKQFIPLVYGLKKEGKIEIVEEFTFENYHKQRGDGHVFVLKKIK